MVIVTGGAGFIGSHLVDRLVRDGEKVTVIDCFSTGAYKHLNSGIILLKQGPIEMSTPKELANLKPKHIYHLAARARIQPSFKDPFGTYQANSTGTMVVLEAAKLCGAKVIYAGSSTADFKPDANPYAYTKWLGEEHCKLYHKHFGVRVALTRFYNVYGPRQIEEGDFATVIGIFEKATREGRTLKITGGGHQKRAFTHVDDIVAGLARLAYTDKPATTVGHVVPLGYKHSHSILEVAKMFVEGDVSKIETVDRPPGEAPNTHADAQQTQTVLGWQPEICIEQYIADFLVKLKADKQRKKAQEDAAANV